MAKDSIGVIFGKTSSLNFRFAVSDSTATKRSDYIKVWSGTKATACMAWKGLNPENWPDKFREKVGEMPEGIRFM